MLVAHFAVNLGLDSSTMTQRIRLSTICLSVVFALFVTSDGSMDFIEEDENLSRREFSGDGEINTPTTNNIATDMIKSISISTSASSDFHSTVQDVKNDSLASGGATDATGENDTQSKTFNETSHLILTSITTNSPEFISTNTSDACKDFSVAAAENLTAICDTNSAYVKLALHDSSCAMLTYTLLVNNESFIMDNNGSWLIYNASNLSSSTSYTFVVNTEYENKSIHMTANCTTAPGTTTKLNLLTIIGSGLSIFFLFVSLICACFIKSIHGPRNTFHVNLSVCLMIANGTILASAFYEQEAISTGAKAVWEIPCFVLPVVIHYFYLASLMWMGLEILFIYRSLVVVIYKPSNPIFLTYVIGYFIPAFIFGLCLILNYTYFNVGNVYGTDESCWLAKSREVALMLLAFALLILLLNIIMFILTSRAISSIKRSKQSHFMVILAKRSSKWLCHLLILHPFVVCSWFLGFLQFRQWKLAPLLFAVFVTLQSFFVFLLHCVLDVCIQQKIKPENDSSLRTTEMRHIMNDYARPVSVSPVISDLTDSSVLPPPYTLVITGDGSTFEHQDLLPKKRRSLKGKKYSWNVSSIKSSMDADNPQSGTSKFDGASFKATEDLSRM